MSIAERLVLAGIVCLCVVGPFGLVLVVEWLRVDAGWYEAEVRADEAVLAKERKAVARRQSSRWFSEEKLERHGDYSNVVECSGMADRIDCCEGASAAACTFGGGTLSMERVRVWESEELLRIPPPWAVGKPGCWDSAGNLVLCEEGGERGAR